MIDLKNQLLMLLMIKAYDVSFYTLLFLISIFYAKDYSYTLYSLCGLNHFNELNNSKIKESNDSNNSNASNDSTQSNNQNESNDLNNLISSISIEIFLHKQNDTLAHSLLD